MADVVKRLNYFDHQFLRAPDFNDEQKYHLSMRRQHNALLHTWGIAQGLTVTAGGTATTLTVSAGVAIDKLGQEIVLPTDTTLDLSGVDPTTNPTVYITIAYHEQQSDPTTEAGGQGNTRWTEQPQPAFSTTAPAPADVGMTLVLGKVPRTAAGLGAIDSSDRRTAGVVVSPDLTVNSLTLKNDTVPQPAWPKLSCPAANQAALTGGNLNLDAGREIFFADTGQIRSLDNNHRLVFNRTQNLMDLYEYGDIRFLTGPTLTEKMRIQASGNVGIGTASPQSKVQVNSLTAIDEGATAAGAWANFGSNAHFDGTWKRIDGTKAGVSLHMNGDDSTGQEFRFMRVEADGTKVRSFAMIGTKATWFLESNVGIGTATPAASLDVANGLLHVGGNTNPTTASQGAYLAWNALTGGTGETDFINNQGQGAGGFAFMNTPASGTPRTTLMVITGGGNVGIGTQSPAESLEANGRIKSGLLTVGPWPANPGSYVFVGTNALDQTNAGNYALLQGSVAEKGQTFLNSPQQINFRIANINKFRLMNDGSLQWGNNSQLYADQGGSIELGGNNTTAGTGIPYIDFHFANGRIEDFNARIINNAEGTLSLQVPFLVATGNALKPGGGAWGSTSDVKLKKNIKPLKTALDNLLKLRGVFYEWKEPEKHANLTGLQMGLIAQEVEEVFPDWVGTDANGFKTVTVRGFEALTIEALRELKAENEALKVKYKELEAKTQTPVKEPKSKA